MLDPNSSDVTDMELGALMKAEGSSEEDLLEESENNAVL